MASKQEAAALAAARRRRSELDRDRDAADARVEAATARAMLVLDQREQDRARLTATTSELAQALHALLGENLAVDRVAALLQLDEGEVRRLTRPVAPDLPGRAASRTGQT